ncbi:hypothetical protein C8250_005495 [Streptomyces sp. So13.3]|uniref:hypothetical protein n=1 Tax=unclassified Streptomyces TaxID=2593676 RepID=UPI00164EA2E2|nr:MULTISPECIES: hypothetical protein [unclassified Streptomyces]MCZ4102265.1 hypothetical protein [Streptomyces sp. H39-C1]QNA71435.1 hypothetical protein C8250_005495 [Streptomyces sp. So13.3]
MTAPYPEFHELTFVTERDEVTVGRPDIESYVTFPADGAELLRRLMDGMETTAAARWYQETYGEPVDITDFLSTLDDCGFVRSEGEDTARLGTVRHQRLGRWLFSPPAWIVFAVLTAAGVVAMVREPQARPHPHAIFLADSLLLTQLVLLLGQIPGLLWHELFHVLAARRLGVGSRMTVGRRMYFLVLETHLDGLLGVPSRRRYLPFTAGVLADVLLFSALTVGAAADAANGGLSWPGRVALAFAFPTLFRIAWQFFFFLRTDLYYMVTTVLGCTDLHEAATARLRRQWRWVPGVRPRPADAGPWSPRDAAVARWYAPAMIGGVILLFGWAALAIIPALVEFVTRVAAGLTGDGGTGLAFWDSIGSVTVILAQFVLPFLLPARKSARREERTT